MKENKTQLTGYAMYYGALFGIYWIVTVAVAAVGMQIPALTAIGNFLSNILIIGIVFLAYRFTIQYRKKALDNRIGAFHAWQFGLMLYTYAALINAIPQYLYLEYLAPNDIISRLFQQNSQVMESLGTDPEILKKAMEQVPKSSISMAVQNIFNYVFIGILLSVPVAFFAKKMPEENTTPINNPK